MNSRTYGGLLGAARLVRGEYEDDERSNAVAALIILILTSGKPP
jgi:hypothetical protein